MVGGIYRAFNNWLLFLGLAQELGLFDDVQQTTFPFGNTLTMIRQWIIDHGNEKAGWFGADNVLDRVRRNFPESFHVSVSRSPGMCSAFGSQPHRNSLSLYSTDQHFSPHFPALKAAEHDLIE